MHQELKGNIRVFCRVRPLSSSEAGPDGALAVELGPTTADELSAGITLLVCVVGDLHGRTVLVSSCGSGVSLSRQSDGPWTFCLLVTGAQSQRTHGHTCCARTSFFQL